MTIPCIANNGSNGEPEVPLWECPCRDCTRMDWEASDQETTLRQFRIDNWPNEWVPGGSQGSAARPASET